ncbi:hypothetical protein PLICRDRAFT_173581 [Plicaturopsis crispa FD-325 SS-3]|nr:hypothetical protein PLICRDRAFT_173581 [Plicaturopsis crispa FD-325 SS-3]
MPRAKSHLTHRKRRRTNTGRAAVDQLSDLPSQAEWDKMVKFGVFEIDNDGVQVPFKVGDTALILPEGKSPEEPMEEHEYWVGKIKDIRQRADQEVVANVQWYWSPDEVAQHDKSFDASHCGKYERIYSDQRNFVSSFSFNEVTSVKPFSETDVDQPSINANEFYCRYRYDHVKRQVIAEPAGMSTCTCNDPYNPDDTDPMHFCSWEKTSAPSDRDLRLLATSPDTDEVVDLSAISAPKPREKKRGRPSKAKPPLVDLSSLPGPLVKVAQLPITRGGHGGSIAGNVASVVKARRMVYAALAAGGEVEDGWEEELDIKRVLARRKAASKGTPFLCPECGGPI